MPMPVRDRRYPPYASRQEWRNQVARHHARKAAERQRTRTITPAEGFWQRETNRTRERFLSLAEARLLEIYHSSATDPTSAVANLEALIPQLIQIANEELNESALTRQAVLQAFRSLKNDPAAQRQFNFLLKRILVKPAPFKMIQGKPPESPPGLVKSGPKIWFLTTNPTIDVHAEGVFDNLDNWTRRKELVTEDFGGGALNVAWETLVAHGVNPNQGRVIFFYGGKDLLDLLEQQGLPGRDGIELPGHLTRPCLFISSGDKSENLLAPGIAVDDQAWEQLENKFFDPTSGIKSGETVIISGSLAPGRTPEQLVQLCLKLRQIGANVIIDTSGKTAKKVIEAKAASEITMNKNEFAELYNISRHNFTNDEAFYKALAQKALETINQDPTETGIKKITITLDKDGAMVITSNYYCWRASAPSVSVASEVGAGDTRAGANAYHVTFDGCSPVQALTLGVAAASFSVGVEGTGRRRFPLSGHRVAELADTVKVTDQVLVTNPFPNGTLPTADELTATITPQDSLPALPFMGPVAIAVGMHLGGHVGTVSSGGADAEVTAENHAASTLDALYEQAGIEMQFMAVGSKGGGAYALRAGRRQGLAHPHGQEHVIADLVECVGNMGRGVGTASSFLVTGPLVQALGPMPNIRTGMVAYYAPGGYTSDLVVDPDAPLKNILQSAAQANSRELTGLEVLMLERDRQVQYKGQLDQLGIKYQTFEHGSFDLALAAMLGLQIEGRSLVFLGSCGATEAWASFALAKALGTPVGLRPHGDLSPIGDIARSQDLTLNELIQQGLFEKAQAAVPETNLHRLDQNQPLKYLFSPEAAKALRTQRAADATSILEGGRLFSPATISMPQKEGDSPVIWLKDYQGAPIARSCLDAAWDDTLVTGVAAYILDSPLLGIRGVTQIHDQDHFLVHSLVIVRVHGETRVWVQPTIVSRAELKRLASHRF